MSGFITNRQGNMAILAAFAIVPVIISLGVSVEYRRAVNTRALLQQSMDAAVLAGARALPAGETRAKQIAAAMFDANAHAVYDADSNVPTTLPIPGFTISNGLISGSVEYNMSTPLLNIVSIASVPIKVASTADSGGAGLELAFVVDVSSSMEDGDKIKELRKSAASLIDQLYGSQETRPNTWLAVVPFDGRVNISDYNSGWIDKSLAPKDAGTNVNCAGLRSVPNRISDVLPEVEKFPPYLTGSKYGDSSTCGGTKARGWTVEKTPIRNILLNLKTGYGTSIWEGAAWGYRMLSPAWKGRWGLADLPHAYGNVAQKVMILMTDGENTPEDYGDPFNTQTANTMQQSICTEMKNHGITIFTIAFDISNSAATPLRNCASNPAYYFNSTRSQGLTAIFTQIGSTLSSGSSRLIH